MIEAGSMEEERRRELWLRALVGSFAWRRRRRRRRRRGGEEEGQQLIDQRQRGDLDIV